MTAPHWFGTKDDRMGYFLLHLDQAGLPIPDVRLRLDPRESGEERAPDPQWTARSLLDVWKEAETGLAEQLGKAGALPYGGVKAPHKPSLEAVAEIQGAVTRTDKARHYIQDGEQPPAGVQIKEGPRGGYYYEDGGRRGGRESKPAKTAKPRLRDVQRTFAQLLKKSGVTEGELDSVSHAWFMKWDSDAGLLMVDTLMGRRAARAHLIAHQGHIPKEYVDQYLDNLHTEDTWYARDLRPGVLSAVRYASQESLRQAGFDKVNLYRGISGEMAAGLNAGKQYRPRPMESWTASRDFATMWAEDMDKHKGAVVKKTIPVEQVFLFSDAVPALRKFGQHEVVVMRGKGDMLHLAAGSGVKLMKARVYLKHGEKPPKGATVKTGPKGGRYYEDTGRKHEPAEWIVDRISDGKALRAHNLAALSNKTLTTLAAALEKERMKLNDLAMGARPGSEMFVAYTRVRDAALDVNAEIKKRGRDASVEGRMIDLQEALTQHGKWDVMDTRSRSELKMAVVDDLAERMEQRLGSNDKKENAALDALSDEAVKVFAARHSLKPVKRPAYGGGEEWQLLDENGVYHDALTSKQVIRSALKLGWDGEDKVIKAAPIWAAAVELAKDDYLGGTSAVEYTMTQKVANMLVKTWAHSSSDNRPASIALQRVVADLFAVEDTTKGRHTSTANANRDADKLVEKHGPVLRAWAESTYASTQQFLEDSGIEELVMARGMGWDKDEEPPEWVGTVTRGTPKKMTVTMNPMSSFSADYNTARDRFSYGQEQVILLAKVPAHRVFSTFQTGVGCAEEYETVVRGGDLDVVATRATHVPVDVDEVYDPIRQGILPRTIKEFEDAMKEQKIELAEDGSVPCIDEELTQADWPKRTNDVFEFVDEDVDKAVVPRDQLDNPDQEVHPKNVAVKVGMPSYVANVEGQAETSKPEEGITTEGEPIYPGSSEETVQERAEGTGNLGVPQPGGRMKKGRHYLGEGDEAPEGAKTEAGPRGGRYYEVHGKPSQRRAGLTNRIRNFNRQGENIPKLVQDLFTNLGIAEQHDLADVYVQDQPILAEVLVLMPAVEDTPNIVWHTYQKADMVNHLQELEDSGYLAPGDAKKAAAVSTIGYDEAEVALATLDDQEWGTGLVGVSGPFDTMRVIAAHEYAHVLDHGMEQKFSSRYQWEQACEAARETKAGFPSMYGRNDPKEMFCECVALMAITPRPFHRKYPGLYNAVSELFDGWNPVEDDAGVQKDFEAELGIPPRRFVTAPGGVHVQVIVTEDIKKGTEPLDTIVTTPFAAQGKTPEQGVTTPNKDYTAKTVTNEGVPGTHDQEDSRGAPVSLAEVAQAVRLITEGVLWLGARRLDAGSDLPTAIGKRGKRRWPSPLELVNMEIGRAKRRMTGHCNAMWKGEIELDDWELLMKREVDDLYGRAAAAAIRRARDVEGARQRARDDLLIELRDQRRYLAGFRTDLATKGISQKRLIQRAQMYANGAAGLYHSVVSGALPVRKAYWHLALEAAHCPDCLEMAERSPFPSNNMPRLPKDGSTTCAANCKCYLTYGPIPRKRRHKN